jgi:hypothetical protein
VKLFTEHYEAFRSDFLMEMFIYYSDFISMAAARLDKNGVTTE